MSYAREHTFATPEYQNDLVARMMYNTHKKAHRGSEVPISNTRIFKACEDEIPGALPTGKLEIPGRPYDMRNHAAPPGFGWEAPHDTQQLF